MKNQQKILSLILFLTFIVTLKAQCPGELGLKDVEHGMFKLVNLTPTDPTANTEVIAFKEYSVITKTPLKDPKILLALGEMSVLTSTIDLFDINIISKSDTQFVLGFIYEPLKWSKISYRYLISDRNDINFRMITLSSVSFKSTDNNSIVAEAELDPPLQNFDKFQVLSFVRGLKYKNNDLVDHSLAVSIVSSKLQQKTIVFNVSAATSSVKVELELLSVSYLYFESKQASFVSFGGLISRDNFVGKSQIDILHADLPTDLYWLYGITNIDISGKLLEISSEITEDSFFNLTSTLSAKKIQFTYFSLGAKASQVCQNCVQKIISGTNCVKDCRLDEIYYQFQDGTKACQICPGALLSDSERKSCVEAGSDQVLKISTVPNQPNQVQQQKETYIPPVNLDEKKAAETSQMIQQETQANSEISQPYQTEGVKNPLTLQPLPKRQQVLSSSSNINIVSSQADEFRYCNTLINSYWTGESCKCKVGFSMNSGACISIQSVEENIIDNPAVGSNTLHPNSKMSNPKHKLYLDKGMDLNHQNTVFVSVVPQSQSTKCPSDSQVYNTETLQCECKPGMGYKMNLDEESFNCVKCSEFSGFYLESGHCQYCGDNQLYDEVKKECLCITGFSFDSQKNCVSTPLPVAVSGEKKPQTIEQNSSLTTERRRQRDQNIASNQSNSTSVIPTLSSTTSASVNSSSQTSTASPTDISAKNVSVADKQTIKVISSQQVTSTTQTGSKQSQAPNSVIPTTQTPISTPIPTPAPVITPSATSASTPSPVPVPPPQDCMKLMKTPQINVANIFVSLELSGQKNFKSEDEMQSFLKQQFAQDFSKPSSIYCNQNDSSLKEFDCLLLYPNGVPNQNFDITFWFNDSASGSKCSLIVPVNPLESAAKSMRSLRRRPN